MAQALHTQPRLFIHGPGLYTQPRLFIQGPGSSYKAQALNTRSRLFIHGPGSSYTAQALHTWPGSLYTAQALHTRPMPHKLHKYCQSGVAYRIFFWGGGGGGLLKVYGTVHPSRKSEVYLDYTCYQSTASREHHGGKYLLSLRHKMI